MVIGDRIKDLREKRDIKQIELAKLLKISKSVMSRIEASKRPVEHTLLIKLTEVLEASADYLLGISIKVDSHLSHNDKMIINLLKQIPEAQKLAIRNLIETMRLNKEGGLGENN